MNKKILVDVNPLETRVALLEDGELVELYLERRGHERLVGNIYKGIVQNVLPGMQAAFVDIGLEKNAFLYARDILTNRSNFEFQNGGAQEVKVPNIKELIRPGQEIMVQVFKEPGGTKGTRVTTNITLPGRMLVLMPTINYIGVSRRIDDETERTRLKAELEHIADDNMGVIARTMAKHKDRAAFEEEYRFLKRLWQKLDEKNHKLSAPRLIHSEESLIYRTIRDMLNDSIEEMLISDQDMFERASIIGEMVAGPLARRIKHFSAPGDENIIDYYNLNTAIKKAGDRKVWLKSGGYLIIDHTEALTVIDVNTGKFVGNVDFCKTALTTNLEAAREVARQMRLRNISGIIVVDFIDMLEEEDRQLVLTMLEEFLAFDKTKTSVVGMSDLGLVEITRKKERMSLSGIMLKDCPYCGGSGKIANNQTVVLEIYKQVEKLLRHTDAGVIKIKLHENVAQSFNDHTRELFMDLAGIKGRKIVLCPTYNIHEEKHEITVIPSLKGIETGKCVQFIG